MKRLYLLLFGMMLFPLVHAKIVRVNNNSGMAADYNNLAAAITAATAGDTIHIEGSVTPYTGNVTVSKRVVIIGPGYFLASTAETQYNRETAKLNGNITFDTGSAGSVLAGVVQHTGATGAYGVNTNAYTGNKVIVQTNDITIVSCKLFRMEINNAQPLSNITVQRCFFNPGVIAVDGAAQVSNLAVTNCFFRNDFVSAPNSYRVIRSTSGIQAGWRISQSTFYNMFSVVAENTTFTNNVFYGSSAAAGTITDSPSNAYTDNVMRYAVGGMTNGTNRNIIPAMVAETQWFSRTGGDPAIDIYYTSASASSDCPLRDGAEPGSDSRSKGMYGGGAPYVKSGMFTVPSVYDVAMDAEVGDNFNMVIKARTH